MAEAPKSVLHKGLFSDNPIVRQVLGVCSALAVTNLVQNTLVMCLGVIFVLCCSNLAVSLLRNAIPQRVRLVAQVFIIACFVMMVDIVIKAFSPDIHRFIGPYVGLIITNCIIMGRAEAFAAQNRPGLALLDGLANGLGYSLVLLAIACVREPLGFGTLLGIPLPGRDIFWHAWIIMAMPPGAFFTLALLVWFVRARQQKEARK
jgi:Na+-transporting NADH:ubiquinone oxidoreductase subunit D